MKSTRSKIICIDISAYPYHSIKVKDAIILTFKE